MCIALCSFILSLLLHYPEVAAEVKEYFTEKAICRDDVIETLWK